MTYKDKIFTLEEVEAMKNSYESLGERYLATQLADTMRENEALKHKLAHWEALYDSPNKHSDVSEKAKQEAINKDYWDTQRRLNQAKTSVVYETEKDAEAAEFERKLP